MPNINVFKCNCPCCGEVREIFYYISMPRHDIKLCRECMKELETTIHSELQKENGR